MFKKKKSVDPYHDCLVKQCHNVLAESAVSFDSGPVICLVNQTCMDHALVGLLEREPKLFNVKLARNLGVSFLLPAKKKMFLLLGVSQTKAANLNNFDQDFINLVSQPRMFQESLEQIKQVMEFFLYMFFFHTLCSRLTNLLMCLCSS